MLMKENQQRYESLFENHPDPVLLLSREAEILNMNDAGEKITGYTKDELLPFKSNLLHEDQELYRRHFHQALKGESQEFESIIRYKAGQAILLRITLVPIMVDKEIIGVYCIAKDISEYRKMQRSLLESILNLLSYSRRVVYYKRSVQVKKKNGEKVRNHEYISCQKFKPRIWRSRDFQ
ncbi:PAS domain S-box protein [Ferviditalea candida]|uniref:PAS domain S-box protein n=1 Tax=Ferviditalea candida TaxID=3108399 RepID=A0ABU5ZGW2_9BACL|nr:PAS domain S-box protein [Paenibacillaceae bacterium T2]